MTVRRLIFAVVILQIRSLSHPSITNMQELTAIEDLKQAYDALRKQAEALAEEFEDSEVTKIVQQLETDFFEEQTAKELGVAGAIALGLSVLHTTIKTLIPAKAAVPIIGGVWLVGGAFIIFRLTAGTVAGWVASTERNARRKRVLQQRLDIIQDRIRLMVHTQALLLNTAAATAGGGRESPAGSTGSSADFVEAPSSKTFMMMLEEDKKKEQQHGSDMSAAAAAAVVASTQGQGESSISKRFGMDSWKRYASLSGKRVVGGDKEEL